MMICEQCDNIRRRLAFGGFVTDEEYYHLANCPSNKLPVRISTWHDDLLPLPVWNRGIL